MEEYQGDHLATVNETPHVEPLVLDIEENVNVEIQTVLLLFGFSNLGLLFIPLSQKKL